MPNLAPNTGSIIEGPGGRDATFTGISTNIVVRIGATAVGAIQKISVNEKRTVQPVDEVGTDGHIDSVPTKSTDYDGTCSRTRFERLRITEAFSRGFLHVKSQRIPFDIDIYDNWNGDGANSIITTIKNVWITSISYTYSSTDWIIIDEMGWMAEDIYSTLNGGNAATGGLLGANIMQLNSIERAADSGQRLGSLDAPNLITDFFSNV